MPHFTNGQAFVVNSVTIGVQEATAGPSPRPAPCGFPNPATTQPVDVRVYTTTTATGAFPGGTRTQIAQMSICLSDQAGTIAVLPIAATIPAGVLETVVEVHVPNRVAAFDTFFIGSNSQGQDGPSYISATDCGILTPTDLATIGYPNMHIVMNVNGSCLGSSSPPTVATGGATNITDTSATLNGTVNPNGASTLVHFEYGTTTYSFTTPDQVFNGNLSQSVSANITGLTPSTLYHFRIVGNNANGPATGNDATFTTAAPSPTPTPTPTPTPNPCPSAPPVAQYGILYCPAPGSTLSSSSVTFRWTQGTSATAYWLLIGDDNGIGPSPTPAPGPCGNDPSRAGGSNIFSSGQTGGLAWNVTNLPTDGRRLYVRLLSKIGGVWSSPQDYVYTAGTGAPLKPGIVPNGGTFSNSVTVTLTSATPCVTIRYTTNGSDPTAFSTLYTGPFNITTHGTTTLKAKSFRGSGESPVSTATFTIN